MKILNNFRSCWLPLGIFIALMPSQMTHAADKKAVVGEEGQLKTRQIQKLKREKELNQATSIVFSPRGEYAYAAAFGNDTISIFDPGIEDGRLEFRESLTADHYAGAVSFQLSPNGEYGALTAFRAEAVILFQRNRKTGGLQELDHMSLKKDGIAGLDFCIASVFSADSQFLYAIGSSAIEAFKIKGDKLEHVQSLADPGDEVFQNGRGLAVSPDGRWLYSVWCGGDALVVYERDIKTGELKHSQTLNELNGLDGVMRVAVSSKGKHVYTSGGRFGGVNAVCAFEVDAEGKLKHLQTLSGKDLPENFKGGNAIRISPGGGVVAVACTLSDHLALFKRDSITGKLRVGDCLQSGEKVMPGAAGVAFDPMGMTILVADEKSHSIVVFRRPKP